MRLLSLWLLMMILVNGYSQVATVLDEHTMQPLQGVSISGGSPAKVVYTDEYGKAAISGFEKQDTLRISLFGYNEMAIRYTDLEKNNFKVRISATSLLLDEAVVSSYTEDVIRHTSLHIEPLQLQEIDEHGAFSLTDALAKMPGVDQLSTGPGVSKPVVRGLYGNRVLVLFSGLRFDNQQWQDEHGMGLSDIGIQKVEVIKGPLSLLYGTGAMGGVINIIEESAPEKGTSETDVKLTGYTNTGGLTLQGGTKVNRGNKWYRIRGAVTNHADYTDGNHERVLNSRFNGYYLKGSMGFTKANWHSVNHYSFSYNNFGFIFNDITHFMESDSRWSRQMSGPHHKVMLNILSSINKIQLKNSVLNLNVGVQSNYRAEDEGGDELSLQMHLLTTQYALKWNKRLSQHWSLVVANNSSYENNTNFGKRKIVPDANLAESALSVYLKNEYDHWIMEYGLGGGVKYIQTLETPSVNSAEKDIDPFEQLRPFYNGMVGVSYIPDSRLNVKANLATGVRAPNLAELSSNGLHEGIYTYEIGDPDMSNEQNINGDVGFYYSDNVIDFSVSGYYNHFNGYVYLEPTSEEWFGFPIYRFVQHDADIYGSEWTVGISPPFTKGVRLAATYSQLVGKLDDGEYLPYMPAQKVKPEIRYDYSMKNGKSFYGFVSSDFVLTQDKINVEENETPAYTLLNAGFGFRFSSAKAGYSINLSGTNLLNEAYYDHMSRLKNFGLLNMGRNVVITLKVNFKNQIKK